MTTVVENKKKLTTVEENKENNKEKELTGSQIYALLTLGI